MIRITQTEQAAAEKRRRRRRESNREEEQEAEVIRWDHVVYHKAETFEDAFSCDA